MFVHLLCHIVQMYVCVHVLFCIIQIPTLSIPVYFFISLTVNAALQCVLCLTDICWSDRALQSDKALAV